ncbi:hypothetical protein BZA70DRAFT_83852 [Myxozyma melibiosi]|uniref:ABM domain-containing protein n=1 Tax=Myxozyma melibiosi TaxID=54550 RepID=A0ABR1EZZ4_9ASCO
MKDSAISPSCYAVIFHSCRASHPDPRPTNDIAANSNSNPNDDDDDASSKAYAATSDAMLELARKQPGFLSVYSARDPVSLEGITVSYWKTLDDVRAFRREDEHRRAQARGKKEWYSWYKVVISKVERTYGFESVNSL